MTINHSLLALGTGYEMISNTETLMVVDDDEFVRKAVSNSLRKRGYNVVEANCGKQALSLAATIKLRLVLSDIMMPGISGIELAQQIRTTWPSIKIILMSAYTDDWEVSKKAVLSPFHFIQKPFLFSELLDYIRSVLNEPNPIIDPADQRVIPSLNSSVSHSLSSNA